MTFATCLNYIYFEIKYFFKVEGKGGEKPIGRITKQRSGFVQKCFTDATHFTVQFPMDMDVKTKAVLMGACFLIVSIKLI